jgi:hypothetical protein
VPIPKCQDLEILYRSIIMQSYKNVALIVTEIHSNKFSGHLREVIFVLRPFYGVWSYMG